ncbi:MAG: DNA polymerase I, partial [Rhodospirillaceae bacterium]
AEGAEVTIVSSDKDLMQLVQDGVGMLDPMKNRSIGPDQVFEKFGVAPNKVVDVQALAGDSVDNVPGVPGIGVKTAAQLIETYGDLESLLARAEEIKQPKRRQNLIEHAELARVSLRLVTLRDDVEVEQTLSDFVVKEPDPPVLGAFLKENGFKSILARFGISAEADDGAADGAGSAGSSGAGTSKAPEKDYALVTTIEDLQSWVEAATAQGFVAVDTETDSLNARQATLVGVSLALAPGRACYIPFAHRDPDAGGPAELYLGGGDGASEADATKAETAVVNIPHAPALALLKGLMEDPSVLKIGHNLKYDIHVLAGVGIAPSPIDDTMVMSYGLEGSGQGHGMDALAQKHLGITTIPFSEVCGTGKAQITFDLVPLDKALAYAAEDADITLRLYHLFKADLLKQKRVAVYETLDRPMVQVLADMEAQGILVDAPRLKDLSDSFARRMVDLEDEIHGLAGHPFNIGSPKQLGEVLFGEMGLPGGKKSRKTGAWSTDASVLEELAAQGHDLPVKVLEWRQYSKLKSTYTDALQNQIDPRDGRVHTTYGLTHVNTGRLSSNDPNLQNIPVRTEAGRQIREAFIAKPGHVLISADYSQIELRLVAHVAVIKALRQAFAEGLDIHAITASRVFGVPVEGMDPMVRRQAKAINFGIIYGISAHGLARQLGISRGVEVTGDHDAIEQAPALPDFDTVNPSSRTFDIPVA